MVVKRITRKLNGKGRVSRKRVVGSGKRVVSSGQKTMRGGYGMPKGYGPNKYKASHAFAQQKARNHAPPNSPKVAPLFSQANRNKQYYSSTNGYVPTHTTLQPVAPKVPSRLKELFTSVKGFPGDIRRRFNAFRTSRQRQRRQMQINKDFSQTTSPNPNPNPNSYA